MPQISIIKKLDIQKAHRLDDLSNIAFAFEKWGRENELSFWEN